MLDACRPMAVKGDNVTGYVTPQYYYLNPSPSQNTKLSLNLDGTDINSRRAITLLFFVKIYGFSAVSGQTTPDTRILILDDTNNVYFKLDTRDGSPHPVGDGHNYISFYNGSTTVPMYKYKIQGDDEYEYYTYGQWWPISISYYNASNEEFFPTLNSCTILFTNMQTTKTFVNISIREISIPQSIIASFSEITLYKTFITNPYAIYKQKGNYKRHDRFVLRSYSMKSSSANCVSDLDLLNTTASSLGVKCVVDFNLFEYAQVCFLAGENLLNNYTRTDYYEVRFSEGVWSLCNYTANTGCLNASTLNFPCNYVGSYYNFSHEFNGDWDSTYTILMWFGNTLSLYIGAGFNANRWENGDIPNISKLSDVYSIDFWFNNNSYVGNNFVSFELSWNKHLRGQISYDGTNYYAKCNPVIDLNKPEDDVTPYVMPIPSGQNTWIYFTCSVNRIFKFGFLSLDASSPLTNTYFTSNIVLIATESIVLRVSDSSPTNYGRTHARSLRLWNCFGCAGINLNL